MNTTDVIYRLQRLAREAEWKKDKQTEATARKALALIIKLNDQRVRYAIR